MFDGPIPLVGGRDHFLLPNVFADHEQVILRAERYGHIEVAFAALDMKFLHARIKINEPHAHPYYADDRQLQFIAGLFDHRDAVAGVVVERILKNIHAVEAKFLGPVQPVDQADAVLLPS